MIKIFKHLDLGKMHLLLKGVTMLITELPITSLTPYFHSQSAPSNCSPHSRCPLQLRFHFTFLRLASAPARIAIVLQYQAWKVMPLMH